MSGDVKVYGFRRSAFTMTMADNGTTATLGGYGQSGGARGVTDPADGIMDILEFSWGSIGIVSGTWVAADISYTAATTRGGTYTAVNDKDGTLVRSKIGSNTAGWFSIPTDVFMAGPFIKIVSTNTASAATVSQTGGPMVFSVLLGA